jgi:NADPH-dependent curcumin reductase CurA
MTKITAKQYILQNYADYQAPVNLNYGTADATFKLITKEYDTDASLGKDEVLVETLYLSNDPAQKGWFTPYESYIPPVPLGSVAPARGIGRVIRSASELYAEGDFISAGLGWSTHNIINAEAPMTVKLDASKVPHLTKYLSAYGSTTLTGYFNATKYSGVNAEDEGKVWLITGAAGAAGSSLVQIVANLYKPKKILAVAGGEAKRAWIETLGPNIIGLDYKSDSYKDDFVRALGDDKINVFADHVGGWLLDHAIQYMVVHGKIVQIGAIACYNGDSDNVFNNYNDVITKRLTIQGMVLVDELQNVAAAFVDLTKWFSAGKLDITKFEETVVQAQGDDFKKVPLLWTGLFTGSNRGKYITQVGQYP